MLADSLLLRHVEEHEPHVFVRDRGPYPHVADDRRHHSRRKLVWSGMATAAVGAKPLLSLHPHGVGFGAAPHHRRADAGTSFSLLRGGSAAYADDTNANTAVRIVTRIFILAPLFPAEGRNGRPDPQSRVHISIGIEATAVTGRSLEAILGCSSSARSLPAACLRQAGRTLRLRPHRSLRRTVAARGPRFRCGAAPSARRAPGSGGRRLRSSSRCHRASARTRSAD